MKLGKKKSTDAVRNVLGTTRPAINKSKKNIRVIGIVVVTVLSITWVYSMGRKAEQTVEVVMLSQNIYKNQVVTETMLKPYDMLKGEFEKYSVVEKNGTKTRRILLWEERNKILNGFAAFPLQQDTYAEYRDFIKSRVDNSDNVLYSFPGKELVPLEIGSEELQSFKTYLQPGDKLNVEATFSQKQVVAEDDGLGGQTRSQMEVFKTENVFTDIMIADLLNQQGESILDIYSAYNDKTVYEQAQLDASQTFKDSTAPKTLLVALTPEEKDRYYYYLSKNQITFRVSMPQRAE